MSNKAVLWLFRLASIAGVFFFGFSIGASSGRTAANISYNDELGELRSAVNAIGNRNSDLERTNYESRKLAAGSIAAVEAALIEAGKIREANSRAILLIKAIRDYSKELRKAVSLATP